jgi:protein-L-isoaspartate(D-aspartate) O-methyltransferase
VSLPQNGSVDLGDFRKFYADLVTAGAGVRDARIRSAFEVVPREAFLGAGPWKVFASHRYVETPSSNPALLYQDIVVAILPHRHINNGQPSLHALCLGAISPQAGERVLHIGAGTGYYSAILAELVGPEGCVEAIEIEPQLAEAAALNLQPRRNIVVHCRSGTEPPLPLCDVIYVNAGASEPLGVWLDALKPGGRLIFPLTAGRHRGGMLLVSRGQDGYAASLVCPACFIPCVGGQPDTASRKLIEAFDRGGWRDVRWLYRGDRIPDETCWLAGDDWWLSARRPI